MSGFFLDRFSLEDKTDTLVHYPYSQLASLSLIKVYLEKTCQLIVMIVVNYPAVNKPHTSAAFSQWNIGIRVPIDRKVLLRPNGPELYIIFIYLIRIELNWFTEKICLKEAVTAFLGGISDTALWFSQIILIHLAWFSFLVIY